MSYGRRDLLQDLELPRCGPWWALEEQSQELRATQPPRWTEKGKVMEGFEQLCCSAAAAAAGLLPGIWWWASGCHW